MILLVAVQICKTTKIPSEKLHDNSASSGLRVNYTSLPQMLKLFSVPNKMKSQMKKIME